MGWDERLFVIAVFLHFESHLPDRQCELNYFLNDHPFHFLVVIEWNETNARYPLPTSSSTLTSYIVHYVWTMARIQLTNESMEEGRWGSGSVINYRKISFYKDPSPLACHFSQHAVNLINQHQSLHCWRPFQPESSDFMARSIHLLHLSVLQSWSQ